MTNTPLIQQMIVHNQGDPKRIQHFIKVYEFAKMIGELEGLDEETQHILETAAIVHDIGIKPAEEKYGSCSGPLQEKEGEPVAREMLTNLGYAEKVVERVAYLVAHHHTYQNIQGLDYQILVEADFLVNLYEDGAGKEAVTQAFQRIFVTAAGKELCKTMFALA